jgi:hypothetical protein
MYSKKIEAKFMKLNLVQIGLLSTIEKVWKLNLKNEVAFSIWRYETQVEWPFKGSLDKLSKCPNHSKFNIKVKSILNWELNTLLEIYFQGLQLF